MAVNTDPRCPRCGCYLAHVGPYHIFDCVGTPSVFDALTRRVEELERTISALQTGKPSPDTEKGR
jgi:hypothetical protein